MTDRSLHSRRFRACLAVCAGYLSLASLVLIARLKLIDFGFPVLLWELEALRSSISLHLLALALLVGLVLLSRRYKEMSPLPSKVALASIPFVFLVSIDRIATISFEPTPEKTVLQRHPTRGWTNRPGWIEQHEGRVVRINSKGLRGPEIPYEKPDGGKRILFLGDSLTFGVRVDERDCFVQQLARYAELNGNPSRLTCINCSVTGYSPWQEYDLLRFEGLKYEPDVVIQVFCLNDVVERFRLERFGGATRGLEPAVPSPIEWSGLYRVMRWIIDDWVAPGQSEREQRERLYSVERVIEEPDAPEIREAWQITLSNLDKIHSLCREQGIPLAIVCFPYAEQVSPFAPETPSPQQELAAFAESAGIPLLDLLPLYRAYCQQEDVLKRTGRGWEGLAVLPDRIHPTQEGHKLAAEAIYWFLIDAGLIER